MVWVGGVDYELEVKELLDAGRSANYLRKRKKEGNG
jgi:hypothetical protein